MKKRKQPCRHYRKWWGLSLGVFREFIIMDNYDDKLCPNCVHWWNRELCRRDGKSTLDNKRYTCRHFRGIFAKIRKEKQ